MKIWFQNRRTKWKKMEYGTGIGLNDSETKLTNSDVIAPKTSQVGVASRHDRCQSIDDEHLSIESQVHCNHAHVENMETDGEKRGEDLSSDYKTVVDLSTSKTVLCDNDDETSLERRRRDRARSTSLNGCLSDISL